MTMFKKNGVIKVAIIGAGAAGLCAAHHLALDQERFKFDVYEQEERIGGTWNFTPKTGHNDFGLNIHSSMYMNLRTNLPKEVMGFPDFPFPSCDGNSFILHPFVLEYLEQYASFFKLHKFIKFLSVVEDIYPERQSDGTVIWKLRFVHLLSLQRKTVIYDAVMVCNGHYSVPRMPELDGMKAYKGILMHSHDYRENTPFKNLKVVVLGAGASGVDIALEICENAKEVVLSHNLPERQSPLPKNLRQERGIAKFGTSSVTFLSENTYDCDAVVLCTGYLYTYPFLNHGCKLEIGDQHVVPLYKHLFHAEYPTMAIWAVPKLIVPFPIYNQQVLVYLKFLKGEISLPSTDYMKADAENDFQKRIRNGMKARHAHVMTGELQWEYDDQISAIGHIPPLPPVIRNLFEHVHAARKRDVVNYRNAHFRILDHYTFIEW